MSTRHDRLRACLDGVDFPADKFRLLQAASRSGCDEETFRALRAVPFATYANLPHVLAAVRHADEPLHATG